MKGRSKPGKVRPFRQRFEVIDRFAGFDFDDGLQPVAALQRLQDQIRVDRGVPLPTAAFCSVPGLIPTSKRRRHFA